MTDESIISKSKQKMVSELYLAGMLLKNKVIEYDEYMQLIQKIKSKYK